MCGDNEPNYESSDNCTYHDDEFGTWDVDTEYIHSIPGTAVYVGALVL